MAKTTSNSQIAHLACLEEGQANHTEQMAKVLRLLEGNGQPGMLQRQTVMEQAVTAIQSTLTVTSATMGALENNQRSLQDLLESHLSPRNPEHKTIAGAWERDKWGVVKVLGIITAAIYLAVQTGFLSGVLHILGIPRL